VIFDRFEIHARPSIERAFCKCGNHCEEVSNGWLSVVLFCPKCESVYALKMVKVPQKQLTAKFLEQCRKEINAKHTKVS